MKSLSLTLGSTFMLACALFASESMCQSLKKHRYWKFQGLHGGVGVGAANSSPVKSASKITEPVKNVPLLTSHLLHPMSIEVTEETKNHITMEMGVENFKHIETIAFSAHTNEKFAITFPVSGVVHSKDIQPVFIPVTDSNSVSISEITFCRQASTATVFIKWNDIQRHYAGIAKKLLYGGVFDLEDADDAIDAENLKIHIFIKKDYVALEVPEKDQNLFLNPEAESVLYKIPVRVDYAIRAPTSPLLSKWIVDAPIHVEDTSCVNVLTFASCGFSACAKTVSIGATLLSKYKKRDPEIWQSLLGVLGNSESISKLIYAGFRSNPKNSKITNASKKDRNARFFTIRSPNVFLSSKNVFEGRFNLGEFGLIPKNFLLSREKKISTIQGLKIISANNGVIITEASNDGDFLDSFSNASALHSLLSITQVICMSLECQKRTEEVETTHMHLSQVIIPGILYAIQNEEDHRILSTSLYYYIIKVLHEKKNLSIDYDTVLGYLYNISETSPFLMHETLKQVERSIVRASSLSIPFRRVILGCSCSMNVFLTTCIDEKTSICSLWMKTPDAGSPNILCLLGCECLCKIVDEHSGDCDVIAKGCKSLKKPAAKKPVAKRSAVRTTKAAAPKKESGSIGSGTKTVVSVLSIIVAITSICASVYYVFFV
ncbi:uncharacterized protein NEMAJ01_1551 [Nematocida major]|uniref:uncharacterized protein n=1 Tax=Nematocida major TaxID=1912982 RepID=UPI002008C32E|nr:uncharacterized protein NEMAJ01_1551 [Nematocida major]KAH9386655.1 hypothetical protein NEMAJ01_1551 [Nematocida major]